jgi:mRNA interferase MazF
VKRGDLYYVNPPGFLGKVRPAVIVQANVFNHNPPSVTLCLLTSTLVDLRLRVTLQPSKVNGLEKPSQVMIDKVMTLPLDKLSNRIGAVSAAGALAFRRLRCAQADRVSCISALKTSGDKMPHGPDESFDMPELKLTPELDTALTREARRSRKSKVTLVRDAVARYLEDREDCRDAAAIKKRGERTYSVAEVKKQLGL